MRALNRSGGRPFGSAEWWDEKAEAAEAAAEAARAAAEAARAAEAAAAKGEAEAEGKDSAEDAAAARPRRDAEEVFAPPCSEACSSFFVAECVVDFGGGCDGYEKCRTHLEEYESDSPLFTAGAPLCVVGCADTPAMAAVGSLCDDCEPGDTWPADDGCNACTCPDSGNGSEAHCTEIGCQAAPCNGKECGDVCVAEEGGAQGSVAGFCDSDGVCSVAENFDHVQAGCEDAKHRYITETLYESEGCDGEAYHASFTVENGRCASVSEEYRAAWGREEFRFVGFKVCDRVWHFHSGRARVWTASLDASRL